MPQVQTGQQAATPQEARRQLFHQRLSENKAKLAKLQGFYGTYTRTRVLYKTKDRVVFVKQLANGLLQQADLQYVAKWSGRLFSLTPHPKSLSVELKFSFYLLNQSTAEVRFFSAGANTSMGKFPLQNPTDCTNITAVDIRDYLDRMLENTTASSEWSFLGFSAMEVCIDIYK